MMQVKLSEKPCVFCGKTGPTVSAREKDKDFQGTVCGDHLFALLKKWEKEEASVPATANNA